MENKRRVEKIGLALIIAILFLVIVGRFVLSLGLSNCSEEYVLKDGWTVTINDKVQENVELSKVDMPILHSGDQITLECILPDVGYENTILYFTGVRLIVDAYIGGDKIYSYGKEHLLRRMSVGSGRHLISLPNEYAGKTLMLQFVVGEGDAFTYFEPIAINRAENVGLQFANKRLVAAAISGFLCILGLTIVLVSLFVICYAKEFWRLLLIGLFSCCMGLWSMAYEGVFYIFTNNFYVVSQVEYIALYFAPVPLMLLLCDVRKDAKGLRRFNIRFSTLVVAAFAIISWLLDQLGMVHFSSLLPIFHVIIAFSLTITLVSVLTGIIQLHKSDMVLFIGIVILCIAALVDGVRYNLLKYVFKNVLWLEQSILPYGTLLMMVFMLISYAIYMYDMVKMKTRQEILVMQAYHDGLTGLFNRNKCRELFEELKEDSKKYSILNYDLNDLKYINDNFGHDQGDVLIRSFADVLTKCFEKIGNIIRMGGDEFIVILNTEDDGILEQAITDYHKRMENSKEIYGIELSAAYGLAKAQEIKENRTPETVYNLADERMYEMKKNSKKSR